MRNKRLLLSLFIVFFFTVFSVNTITAEASSTATKEAVVTATSLNVRSGAGTSYKKIATVSKGKIYDVVSTKSGWVKIKLSSSKTGWVSNKYVTVRTKREAVVTATSLNVRSGAGTSYKKIATVSKGKVYNVISTKSGWVKIRLSSTKSGWVSSKYVTLRTKTSASTSTATTVKNKEAVVTATALNVRSGAGTSYKKIATVSKGKVYDAISTKSGWVKIKLSSSKAGWVSSKYVTLRTKSSSSSSSSSSSGSSSTTVNKKAVITTDYLNLRKSASSTSTILASIPYGTQITVSTITGNWAKVTYGSNTGYVHKDYISYDLTSIISSYHIIADSLPIYKSKSKNSEVIYTATKDETLEVRIKDGNWYQVYLSSSEKGYIYIPDNKLSETNTTLPLQEITILLDPGHGGTDPGATGADGSTREKALNLQVSLLVRKELINLGATVVMTRESDVFPSLTDRTNLSNSTEPDAFISLHHDSASASASGFTVYYYHSSHKALASSVSNALGKTSSITNRGVRYGNYHVLRENKYNAILIELGYISNLTELTLLKTASYQKKSAVAIANGIVDFFTK